jgi:hypothetical protein
MLFIGLTLAYRKKVSSSSFFEKVVAFSKKKCVEHFFCLQKSSFTTILALSLYKVKQQVLSFLFLTQKDKKAKI